VGVDAWANLDIFVSAQKREAAREIAQLQHLKSGLFQMVGLLNSPEGRKVGRVNST